MIQSKRNVQPPGRGFDGSRFVSMRVAPPETPLATISGNRSSLRSSGSSARRPVAASAWIDHTEWRTWPASLRPRTRT